MKQNVLMAIGVLGLGISIAQSQTLVNSWENSLEGWSILETGAWTSVGFSTAKGVTQGSYSWELNTTGTDYGPTLQGPASTDMTMLMANADSVTMTLVVGTNAPQFNWGIQIDLEVSQPGGVGTMSVDGGNYPGGIFGDSLTNGSTNILTWPVSQAVRTAFNEHPNLPVSLIFSFGGGGGGTVFIDKLQVTKIPQVQGNLWARELWDDISGELIPARTAVSNNSSSVGFTTDPWAVNPAETNNCALMAFRPGFNNDPVAGALTIGLPSSLDGSFGCLVQENSGFSFFPNATQGSFWSAGDFMTRPLAPGGYINFQAKGEYWFTIQIANKPWDGSSGSLYAQYVTFPSSGWGGIGFANGDTTNADFVAIGATGLNVYYGPTNVSYPWGTTNATKALYISQGKLGQPGNLNSTVYNPTLDPSSNPLDQPPYAAPYNEQYSQTNFTGGPYHINAFGVQTVGHISGDYIVLLGHLTTHGDGTATLDAKYYGAGVGGNPWNTELDMNTNNITWDTSYSFSFPGTMTRMLLFQNGQFPFYVFGFRASTKFNDVVGLDSGRISVSPFANTYVGYPINLTNLAVEANSYSWASPPAGYGTLNYQWYQDGAPISGATSQSLNIASASLSDPGMPNGTDAGTYSCVATDPSGTWGSVTNSVVVTVTQLNPPTVTSVQMLHNQTTFVITYDEPSLTGVTNLAHYVFNNGIVATNISVINSSTSTEVQIRTAPVPLGTKVSLIISGVTNVVGGTLATTTNTFWTDLVRTGAVNWNAWQCSANEVVNTYFNTFLPANPTAPILQSMALTSWSGPTSGVTIPGLDGYVGDDFGDNFYGWFIPPVTTNYVFLISCDDGARLSLSTNESPNNMFVIACDSDWNGGTQWTNITDQYPGPGSPHRGDGTATGVGAPSGYTWDNSIAGQSPATACLQNRSDQFIVAYYDSTGLPGGPAGATTSWATAESRVEYCIPSGMTNLWPNRDVNGQALIHLQAGKMYYMKLEHMQAGGGYNEDVTYKIAGTPDPLSPSATALTGAAIAGTVPFTPTLSIASGVNGPVITYTGVLLAGTSVSGITNVVAQSSAGTAISLGGPSQYNAPNGNSMMFYRTSQ